MPAVGIIHGSRDELLDQLGEGFHTAFRKGLDSPRAHPIWKAINELPPEEWAAVLKYVVWGMEYSEFLTWGETT